MARLLEMELLDLWERGAPLRPAQRALLLLTAAYPDAGAEAVMQLGIGERDARLMELRAQLFGSEFQALTNCPHCGAGVELEFDGSSLQGDASAPVTNTVAVHLAHGVLEFRLPTSADLFAVATDQERGRQRACLLTRCLCNETGLESWTAQEEQEIVSALARHDPRADVELALDCPQCHTTWTDTFDIVGYFWSEIESWARRMLRDVHVLARTYGWSERDILSFSPQRRQIYLGLIMNG